MSIPQKSLIRLFAMISLFIFFTACGSSASTAITEDTWIKLNEKTVSAIVVVIAEMPPQEISPSVQPDTKPDSGFYQRRLVHPIWIVEDREPSTTPLAPRLIGGGTVIDPNGFVMTNEHVVKNATSVTVRFSNGATFLAQTLYTETPNDLALLKIITEKPIVFPFLPVASADKVVAGRPFLNTAHPFARFFTSRTGIIASPPPQQSGNMRPENVFLVAGTFPPGSSGSPILNLNGEVMGVIFGSIENIFSPGFAIMAEPAVKIFREKGLLPLLPNS